MKKINFLNQIKKEGKIGLVEPSKEISESYLIKSENCFKSAKILFENHLYENATSEAYYCMYNSLLALLFRIGIKSENHSASIIVFEELFNELKLAEIISDAKKDRIDKQYYIEFQQISKINQKFCGEIILNSEEFKLKIRVLILNLNNEKIFLLRKTFENLF